MGLITTKDHIKNVVDSIDKTIVVNSVVADGSNWKLMTTNTKWATFGKVLSGKVIKEVVFNESITISAATQPTTGIYDLTSPFFYYGTFLETNSELIKVSSSNNKLPLIYLHMNAPEKFADEESTIDFVSDWIDIKFVIGSNSVFSPVYFLHVFPKINIFEFFLGFLGNKSIIAVPSDLV